ncbi:MAG: FAD-dependent oxidoreductase, partial [Roseiflexaceae bacterium]
MDMIGVHLRPSAFDTKECPLNNAYDAIVIGAGVMGCATAYHLARDGRRVLLLEQFALGHQRGSSHGRARIFRLTYARPEY